MPALTGASILRGEQASSVAESYSECVTDARRHSHRSRSRGRSRERSRVPISSHSHHVLDTHAQTFLKKSPQLILAAKPDARPLLPVRRVMAPATSQESQIMNAVVLKMMIDASQNNNNRNNDEKPTPPTPQKNPANGNEPKANENHSVEPCSVPKAALSPKSECAPSGGTKSEGILVESVCDDQSFPPQSEQTVCPTFSPSSSLSNHSPSAQKVKTSNVLLQPTNAKSSFSPTVRHLPPASKKAFVEESNAEESNAEESNAEESNAEESNAEELKAYHSPSTQTTKCSSSSPVPTSDLTEHLSTTSPASSTHSPPQAALKISTQQPEKKSGFVKAKLFDFPQKDIFSRVVEICCNKNRNFDLSLFAKMQLINYIPRLLQDLSAYKNEIMPQTKSTMCIFPLTNLAKFLSENKLYQLSESAEDLEIKLTKSYRDDLKAVGKFLNRSDTSERNWMKEFEFSVKDSTGIWQNGQLPDDSTVFIQVKSGDLIFMNTEETTTWFPNLFLKENNENKYELGGFILRPETKNKQWRVVANCNDQLQTKNVSQSPADWRDSFDSSSVTQCRTTNDVETKLLQTIKEGNKKEEGDKNTKYRNCAIAYYRIISDN